MKTNPFCAKLLQSQIKGFCLEIDNNVIERS